MIGFFEVIVLALFALLFFALAVHGRPSTTVECINRAAFLQLIDPESDRFLKQHLAPKDYREAVHGRRRVIVAYLIAVRRNAAVYARALRQERSHSEEAARYLIAALQLRAISTLLIPYIALGMDDSLRSVQRIWDRYSEIETAWYRRRTV